VANRRKTIIVDSKTQQKIRGSNFGEEGRNNRGFIKLLWSGGTRSEQFLEGNRVHVKSPLTGNSYQRLSSRSKKTREREGNSRKNCRRDSRKIFPEEGTQTQEERRRRGEYKKGSQPLLTEFLYPRRRESDRRGRRTSDF